MHLVEARLHGFSQEHWLLAREYRSTFRCSVDTSSFHWLGALAQFMVMQEGTDASWPMQILKFNDVSLEEVEVIDV